MVRERQGCHIPILLPPLPQGSFRVHGRSACHSVLTDPVRVLPSLYNSEDHSFSSIAIHQIVLTSCLKGRVLNFFQDVYVY